MKAVFLCAGEGTRLRPITYAIPKALIPVGGKPVLVYGIENVRKVGIEEVILVVNPKNESDFREFFSKNDFGVRIEYAVQERPLGLAHALLSTKELVGDEDILLYLGDNLIFEDIGEFLEEFGGNDALVLLDRVEDPRMFGVAVLEDGFVKRVVEKPKEPPSDLAIVGLYAFKSDIFQVIEKLEPSWRGEYEITDAIQMLVDGGKRVKAKLMKGWWKDVGTLEDLIDANARVLERMNMTIDLGKGGVVQNSRMSGPVLGSGNAEIKSSEIGPNVFIGEGVEIESSIVKNSIVLDGAKIFHSTIEDSFIGRNVRVSGLKTRKTALADHTDVVVRS